MIAATRAKEKADWDHTATIAYYVINVAVAKEDRVRDIRELNPYRRGEAEEGRRISLQDLRKAMTGQ